MVANSLANQRISLTLTVRAHSLVREILIVMLYVVQKGLINAVDNRREAFIEY